MSEIIDVRSGSSAIPEEGITHLTNDLCYQSGVYDLSTHCIVSEHNPLGMSVDIATGVLYFKLSPMTYHGRITAVKNVVIISNSSGNPRIDCIVAYVDKAQSAGTDGTGVLKFKAVAGTPASSPVAPDSTAIQASVGAGNPYTVLANVAVANNASSILNANVTDVRVPAYFSISAGLYNTLIKMAKMKGIYYDTYTKVNCSGATALDCSLYNVFNLTMTDDITLSVSNMLVGQKIQIALKNDGSSRTPTWFANISWADNVEPTKTPTANTIDIYSIEKLTANTYRGYVCGENYLG